MWIPPATLPETLEGDIIAIDTEVKDPYIVDRGPGWCFKKNFDHYIAGISIRAENFTNYLPIAHEGGGNMDSSLVKKWLNHVLSRPDQGKVFANASYDLGWLGREGISIAGKIEDILIQAPLIDENRGPGNYGLDSVASDYIGYGKDESLLAQGYASLRMTESRKKPDIKGNMWRMHSSFVGPYAIQDAVATYETFKVLNKRIDEEDLRRVYDLEISLIPVFLDMRRRGIRVDISKCEQLQVDFKHREDEAIEEIYRLTGIRVSVTASSSKAQALISQGIVLPKTEKTGKDSVTKEILEDIVAKTGNKVALLINQASKLRKARKDFIQSNILEKHENGRVYANFNQLMGDEGGTVGGRLSSNKPNLQNQYSPKKDFELGTAIRSLWLPEEDEIWGSVDYSSQEPRLTVHYATITQQRGAELVASRYRENPKTDYHQMVADMANITRKQAKPINLGLAYGMSEAKLCHDLGLPTVWLSQIKVNRETIFLGKFATEREAAEAHQAAAARYNVRPSFMFNVREVAGPEGEIILTKYHEGSPFLKGLIQITKRKADERGYIVTIGGRKCHFKKGQNGRYEFTYKALNRLIQGSAADQTKKAMLHAFNAGLRITVQVHDEINISAKDKGEIYLLKKIMEEAIPLCIPSLGEATYGEDWGHQKELEENHG